MVRYRDIGPVNIDFASYLNLAIGAGFDVPMRRALTEEVLSWSAREGRFHCLSSYVYSAFTPRVQVLRLELVSLAGAAIDRRSLGQRAFPDAFFPLEHRPLSLLSWLLSARIRELTAHPGTKVTF
jgi:hypothetical protein